MEVCLWRFVEGSEHDGAIRDGSSMSLPSFRSRSGGEILRTAIIHYNDNKCLVTMMRLFVSLEGSFTLGYKGAWLGHHDGSEQILHRVLD
jgi:hypothetical protein